jgi:hypothetical protein
MIIKLTQKQKEKIPAYCKKWRDIGHNTSPINKSESENAIKKYLNIARIKCDTILFFSSPIICNLAYFLLKSQLGSQLHSQLGSQLGSQLHSQLGSQLHSQLHSQLGSQLDSRLLSQLDSQLELNGWTDGNCSVGWCNFYDFIDCELTKMDNNTRKIWNLYCDYVKTSFWIYPFNGICLASDRPSEIHFNDKNQLHNEHGMSVKFSDDWGIYTLNGVSVTKDIVMTPAEKIDPTIILTEKNVEIRREIVKKIGIERVCQKLNSRTIDTGLDYNNKQCELLCIDIHGKTYKYIKLVNPSVEGIYHIEGVSTECNTIEDALTYRKPDILKNIPVDDTNGADWYEQGDVCVWPKNAVSVKSKPIILT